MSQALEYTLSLKDQMSSRLSKVGISSDQALGKFAKLQQKSVEVSKTMAAMGNSIGSLKEKLELLKAERDWIPASNIGAIRKYNQEIGSLEKQIGRLETRSGGWSSKLKESLNQIPGIGVLTNPIVATTAAIGGATKMAMDFDKGMAAINTTAQLSPDKLAKLKKELLSLDPSLVKNWGEIPTAYESIISQTGDVKLSTDILKTSLKGAKAGFTDNATVSAALAQSLSLIGSKNANAQQVLDTFFAAKRVGAGEFKDFAQYMPGLIASGDALGIKYKEVAGMFAYMTGKGQSAERSTVLMENAFSAMSKIDVRKNLADAGINVFDEKGSIRSMTAIFGDLKKKMQGMSDEQKSSFLAKMGLTDKEARSAFIVMTSDVDKLKESMNAVKNSTGETDSALKLAVSDSDRISNIFSIAQQTAIKLGGALSKILGPALQFVSWAGGHLADTISWLVAGIENADPVVLSLVGGVAALTIAYKASSIAMKAQDMWLSILVVKEKLMGVVTKAKAVAMGIATAATYAWEIATIALNAAWAASPIGMIILGVTALGAAVYGVSKLFDQQTAAERLNGEVKSRALEKTIEQKAELGILFDRLRQAKAGTDEYKNALKDLEATYPGIIDKYNLQKGSLADINAAHRELVANIDAVAMQEARKEMLKENYKKKFANETKMRTGDYGLVDYIKMGATGQNQVLNENIKLTADSQFLSSEIAKNEKKASASGERLNKYSSGSNSVMAHSEASKKVNESSVKGKPKPGGNGRGSNGSRSNEAIATGGSKQTTITLTFKNIIESQVIQGKDFKEATQDLQQQTTDAVTRVLAMATSTAG